MKIQETQTTDDFPEGAIKVWAGGVSGGRLLKVTDRTGTAILWERDGTEDAGDVIDAGQAGDAVQPEYPKAACGVCGFEAGNKGALTGHMRAKHPLDSDQSPGNVPGLPERFVIHGVERNLPKPAIQALENLLSNATFQSVRKVGDKPMEDFWYGFASGMQAALAIVCGTLGYNTDFLNQENPDAST